MIYIYMLDNKKSIESTLLKENTNAILLFNNKSLVVFSFVNHKPTPIYNVFNINTLKINILPALCFRLKLDYSIKFFVHNCFKVKILKLQLIGRHFKFFKKSINFIYSLLNKSHKTWLYKEDLLLLSKKRKGKTILCYPSKLSSYKEDYADLVNLRRRNYYTGKGIRGCSYPKIKRWGKGRVL